MRRVTMLLVASALLLGCAGARAGRPTTAASELDSKPEMSAFAQQQAEQQKRIVELESRMALLEAEARRGRDFGKVSQRGNETIRLGASHASAEPEAAAEPMPEPSEQRRDVRPVRARAERVPSLRLYGHDTQAIPEVPSAGDLGPLPVALLPEERAQAELLQPAGGGNAALVAEYREALSLLRARRYDDALTALSALDAKRPEQAIVEKVLYWTGEARYAKREYQLAERDFEALLARYPRTDKAADSLLKLGLCLRRLGDEPGAQAYFRQVREKYPDTQAAAIASREGST